MQMKYTNVKKFIFEVILNFKNVSFYSNSILKYLIICSLINNICVNTYFDCIKKVLRNYGVLYYTTCFNEFDGLVDVCNG